MAKIYETQEDIAREVEKTKLHNARASASSNFDSAIIGTFMATGSHMSEQYDALQSAVYKRPQSAFFSGLNKVFMGLGVITGVMGVVGWWRAHNQEAEAKAKLQVLGPEEVKFSPLAVGEPEQTRGEVLHAERVKQPVASVDRSL
ncbi:MAG: hypothetical protein SFX19_03260 [Alphaproteobacteria bacterium]|nr:hypothetical protein [Alphaproteobacteria bacterium]